MYLKLPKIFHKFSRNINSSISSIIFWFCYFYSSLLFKKEVYSKRGNFEISEDWFSLW